MRELHKKSRKTKRLYSVNQEESDLAIADVVLTLQGGVSPQLGNGKAGRHHAEITDQSDFESDPSPRVNNLTSLSATRLSLRSHPFLIMAG